MFNRKLNEAREELAVARSRIRQLEEMVKREHVPQHRCQYGYSLRQTSLGWSHRIQDLTHNVSVPYLSGSVWETKEIARKSAKLTIDELLRDPAAPIPATKWKKYP